MNTTFKSWALVAFLGTLPPLTVRAECPADTDVLGAVYAITESPAADEDPHSSEWELWRDERRVLHVHPQEHRSELWELGPRDRLRLVRLFDEEQRGIEYQPGEVEDSASDGWPEKRALVPTRLLQAERQVARTGAGCEAVLTYAWNEGDRHYTLEWMPGPELLRTYTVESPERTVAWRLERTVEDPAEVREAFARVDAYPTTDYIDIGDDESDPFLRQMIHMGFVNRHAPH